MGLTIGSGVGVQKLDLDSMTIYIYIYIHTQIISWIGVMETCLLVLLPAIIHHVEGRLW